MSPGSAAAAGRYSAEARSAPGTGGFGWRRLRRL